jgi:hypothetical protein
LGGEDGDAVALGAEVVGEEGGVVADAAGAGRVLAGEEEY